MRRDHLLGVLVVTAAEALIRGVVSVVPASGAVDPEPLTPTALGVRRVLGPLPPPLLPLRYRTATARPPRPAAVPCPGLRVAPAWQLPIAPALLQPAIEPLQSLQISRRRHQIEPQSCWI